MATLRFPEVVATNGIDNLTTGTHQLTFGLNGNDTFMAQPGSEYNGHYGIRCYHPLVLHCEELGDFLAAILRPGNVHTADGAFEFALDGIRWARQRARSVWLRADAGFPSPEFLRRLEAQGVSYVMRLRTNERLKRMAAPLVKRPPGRPPKEGRTWFHELRYRAESWERERRVVLVVVERPDVTEGEDGAVQHRLLLEHFFLLTNVSEEQASAAELLERYRGRGRAEKEFGDWKSALQLRLSSSPRPNSHYRGRPLSGSGPGRDSFAVNEAWLLLNLIVANLLDVGRNLYRQATGHRLSRTRFRRWLLKVGVRVTLGSNQVRVILNAARAGAWSSLWERLRQALPIRGSPEPRTRPLPA